MIDRAHTLELLTRSKPTLAARFGVTRLALFGSAARDSARQDSDIDILVAFDGPATASASCSTSRTSSAAPSIW